MYVPEHFRETRTEVLQAFIERHPLATLVAMTSEGLTANHVPMLSQLSPGGGGLLRGHIARANSLWRRVEPRAAVLAVFTGADGYAMLRAIVGFEIEISGIVGKLKGSQNRPAADRVAVREALRAAGRAAEEIAELVPDS